MELSGSNIKKCLTFSQKKAFLIFQETANLEKNSYIFSKESCSYISGNGNPKKLLIFQEVTFCAQKVKRKHSEKTCYISGKGKKFLVLKDYC